jgi:hypothetical protein
MSSAITPDAHNHRWPLASKILAGKLYVEVMSISSNGPSLNWYRHTPTEQRTRFNLQRLGIQSLQVIMELELATGSIYAHTPEVIHRVNSGSDTGTITLMITGPAVKINTDVYRTSRGPHANHRLAAAEEVFDAAARLESAP